MPNLAKLKNVAIVATYVSPGVKLGAGGFVIVNGKVIKVPPRGPEMQALHEAVQRVMALGSTQRARSKAKAVAA